jgi:hypothetical protein
MDFVPVTQPDERIAGAPYHPPLCTCRDYVERGLLEQIMPKDLFQMAVTAKKTNSVGGGVFKADGKPATKESSNWEEAYITAG